MPIDKKTLNLIGAAFSLLGSFNSLRRSSGKLSKLRSLIGLGAAAVLFYSAYQDRQSELP